MSESDPIDATNEFQEEDEPQSDVALIHLASEWMQELDYKSQLELDASLNRTFDACCALHISIELNFKRVYTFDGKSLRPDWLLSDLGCYLFLINGNPANSKVARAQLYFAKSATSKSSR